MGKERLRENNEITVRKRFFQEMDRAEAGGPFLMSGEMPASQDDGACVWMARSQIVKKFLAEIGHRIGVENEKVRFGVHEQALGLLQCRRHVHGRVWGCFLEGCSNLLG